MTKGVTKTKKLFIVILYCVVASLIVIAGGYTIYAQSHRTEAIEYLQKSILQMPTSL